MQGAGNASARHEERLRQSRVPFGLVMHFFVLARSWTGPPCRVAANTVLLGIKGGPLGPCNYDQAFSMHVLQFAYCAHGMDDQAFLTCLLKA